MAATAQEVSQPPIFNIVFAMLALKLVVEQLQDSIAKDNIWAYLKLRDKKLSAAKREVLSKFIIALIKQCAQPEPIEYIILTDINVETLRELELLPNYKKGSTEKILDEISRLYATLAGMFALRNLAFDHSYSNRPKEKYLLKALYCLANTLGCFHIRVEISTFVDIQLGKDLSQIWTASDDSNANCLFCRVPKDLQFKLPDSMNVMDIALSVLSPEEKEIAQKHKIGSLLEPQTLSMFSAGSNGGGGGNGATAAQPAVH